LLRVSNASQRLDFAGRVPGSTSMSQEGGEPENQEAGKVRIYFKYWAKAG
jgi:hypothetical protein